MSPRARRSLILTGVGVVAWYVIVLLIWAVQPLSDSVPIGVDHSIDPPNGKQVSQTVDCNSLFSSDARDDVALPALNKQPKGFAALEYPRNACAVVQRDARVVFGLNTAFVILVLGGLVVVARRLSQHPPNAPPAVSPEVVRPSMA